jgi:RHS repeat-associated protein
MKIRFLFLFIAPFVLAQPLVAGEQGDDSPVGVSGIQTAITTGGLVDPYTGSGQRQIDDLEVPSAVGKYPLRWTRYFNSHLTYHDNKLGGSWRFSYLDYKHLTSENACTPDGRRISDDYGVEEKVETPYPYTSRILHLPDGGQVVMNAVGSFYVPVQIVDPYGLVTTIVTTGSGSSKITKITEPGGRYLQVNWDTTGNLITTVQAFDGIAGHSAIASVTYTWGNFTVGGTTVKVLTEVKYNDVTTTSYTSAYYTYTDQTYQQPLCTYPFGNVTYHAALLATSDDVRYHGAMRQLAYSYYPLHNKTRVSSEKNLVTGEAVTTITGVQQTGTTTATETRGDGATRNFNYYSVDRCPDCPPPDSEPCQDPTPTDGKLSSFTDFFGHTTTLTYETNDLLASAGFITAVTDANNHTTTYTRQTGSWGITKITYPDGTSIEQTFWAAPNDTNSQTQPYYLSSRTFQHGPTDPAYTVVYTRDSSNRITRKDYPTPDATGLDPTPAAVYETFAYNNFNEVLAHRMTNGAYEYFKYDSRGLLTDKTNPTWNYYNYDVNNLGNWPSNEPAVHNTYYTTGPWTDRIQTVTYPANASGLSASETYDYDRAYDVNGENSGASTAQAAVAGRGLVTRITHGDGKYQAFGYDKYGNKLWQEDELRHRTTMTYDAYRRVLTTKDPLNHTITNSYVPTGKTSSWITTSSLPFSTTLASGKQTTFEYDANWRKRFVHQAPNTADAANTEWRYDEGTGNIGHLTTMVDPRGYATTYGYDIRDRQTSVTDALNHTTSCHYNLRGQKDTETLANGQVATNIYDKLNRVIQVQTTRDATTTDVRNVAYDAAGNQVKFQDENATARSDTTNIYRNTYDFANRITSASYPNNLHEDTSYDAAGNVVTYKNRAGAIKTFGQFDIRNRSHYFSWNDGITPWQSTNYDDASRVTQIANSVSTINNGYSDDNLLTTQEEWTSVNNDNNHRTVTYVYDADHNRQTITYPSGTLFNYNYTQRNQVSSIADSVQNHIVDYTFDASGNITNRALDNGTSTAYTVDQVNRDTAVAHTLAPNTVIKRFDYAYNNVNDILAVRRDNNTNDGDGYRYDLTQEILEYKQNGAVDLVAGTVTNPQTDTNLTFDGCGNTTSSSLNGGASGTFVIDYLNEYTTFNNQSVTNDSDGDVLGYNGWTYTYDAQNRLLNASSGNTTIATFYYDGLNRQIARSINGVVTFSVWDGDWAILEEYGTGNVVTQKYLQGYHGLVKTFVGTPVYYYQDELGSTSHIANSTGGLVESYQYNLYGKPKVYDASGQYQQNATPQAKDLGNGGARWIPELALYDDRNRFMSPDLGRFIQPDPIGFKGDASNLYRYCHNDWANKTDPMGTSDYALAEHYAGEYGTKVWQNEKLGEASQRLAALQQRLNDKIAFGYGATQISGLVNKIEHLQQSISVVGQVLGPKVDYKNAPMGNPNSPYAPTSLKILERPREGNATFTNYHLQAMHGGTPLTGDIAARETVTLDPKSKANFRYDFGNTNRDFIHGRKGSFPDQVGLVKYIGGVARSVKLAPNAKADIWKTQTYQVWYEGARYNIPGSFTQHTVVSGPTVTNDLY